VSTKWQRKSGRRDRAARRHRFSTISIKSALQSEDTMNANITHAMAAHVVRYFLRRRRYFGVTVAIPFRSFLSRLLFRRSSRITISEPPQRNSIPKPCMYSKSALRVSVNCHRNLLNCIIPLNHNLQSPYRRRLHRRFQ
jgi:hypothetical protein